MPQAGAQKQAGAWKHLPAGCLLVLSDAYRRRGYFLSLVSSTFSSRSVEMGFWKTPESPSWL